MKTIYFEDDFGSPMPIKLCSVELSHDKGQCWNPVHLITTHNGRYEHVYDVCGGHYNRMYGGKKALNDPVVPTNNRFGATENKDEAKRAMINSLFGHRFARRCVAMTNYTEGGYDAIHKRVAQKNGKACLWNCVDCGYVADQWSYNNSGMYERISNGRRSLGFRYSIDFNQYEPRCKSCHRKFDNEARA